MGKVAPFNAALIILFLTMTNSYAGPCQDSIDRVQVQVDAAIDKSAGAGPWRPESLSATRSRQPTPESIAAAEGASGRAQQRALKAIGRARAADSAGNVALCNAELKKAKRALALP
jgi:hypothetical protein